MTATDTNPDHVTSPVSALRRWPVRHRGAALLLGTGTAFVAAMCWVWWGSPHDDLASVYVAARLVAQGKLAHLYDHDAVQFHVVRSTAWQGAAAQVHFGGFLHPYLNLPLLAAAVSPVTGVASFVAAGRVLLVLNAAAVAGTVFLVGRLYEPRLLRPVVYAGVLLVVAVSEPLRYGLFLGQLTPLVLFAVVLALYLARHRHRLAAGLLLAAATAVIPAYGAVALYWLCSRGQRRAAGAFVAGLVGLAALSVAVAGVPVNHDYLSTLGRLARTGLTAVNNQSLDGALLGIGGPRRQVFGFGVHHLPVSVWVANLALFVTALAAVTTKAVAARRRGASYDGLLVAAAVLLPLMFATLSFTHYYLAMLVPLAVLHREYRDHPPPWGYPLLLAVIFLNLQPLAVNVVGLDPRNSLLRAHLFSAVLALLGLLVLRLPSAGTPAEVEPAAVGRRAATEGLVRV